MCAVAITALIGFYLGVGCMYGLESFLHVFPILWKELPTEDGWGPGAWYRFALCIAALLRLATDTLTWPYQMWLYRDGFRDNRYT